MKYQGESQEMSSLTVALFGAVCSSLAFGYFLGKFRGSRRDADDYIPKSARGPKQTDGLKTFLEYVAEHSSPEPHSVAELRKVGYKKKTRIHNFGSHILIISPFLYSKTSFISLPPLSGVRLET